MQINGTLKTVFETKQVSPTFQTREFVVETKEQYPQSILFQLVQDKCDIIDVYTEGEEIVVHFNLRGREWLSPTGEVKYFNTISAWRISRPENANQPQQHHSDHPTNIPPKNQPEPKPFIPESEFNEEEEDDLPF